MHCLAIASGTGQVGSYQVGNPTKACSKGSALGNDEQKKALCGLHGGDTSP